MIVGLHDADHVGGKKRRKPPYPNLALLKLSAWHKARGDTVKWWMPLGTFDKIYSSKVFLFTPPDPYLPADAIKGGPGYGSYESLPDTVEHTCPDYSLYGLTHSLGFTTRGCIRRCPWCIVPLKEGAIRDHADVEEFLRHRDVVLMDNNALAHEHGIRQMENLVRLGVRVDYNQGLDARLIDAPVAHLLSSLRWIRYLRLACDSPQMMPIIERAVQRLRNAGYSREIFCYCLIQDPDEALARINFLRSIGVSPFAQPYRDLGANPAPISMERKQISYWCNNPRIRESVPFSEFDDAKRKKIKTLARWTNTKTVFKACTFEEYIRNQGVNA